MAGICGNRRAPTTCAPELLSPLRLQQLDHSTVLECEVDGCPKPEIRWEKDNRTVPRSRRVQMSRSGNKCCLSFKSLQPSDSGMYSCVATNFVGTVTTHMKISFPTITMNGSSNSSHKLNPVVSIKVCKFKSAEESRSRSSERSKEKSTKTSKPILRSRSPSREPESKTLKKTHSRSNFFNFIWRKNDSTSGTKQPPEKMVDRVNNSLEHTQVNEDNIKSRRGFLNRVKIPDVFSCNKKQDDPPKVLLNLPKRSHSVVTKRDRQNDSKSDYEVDFLEDIDKDSKRTNVVFGSDSRLNKPSKRVNGNKITQYLKRFESLTLPSERSTCVRNGYKQSNGWSSQSNSTQTNVPPLVFKEGNISSKISEIKQRISDRLSNSDSKTPPDVPKLIDHGLSDYPNSGLDATHINDINMDNITDNNLNPVLMLKHECPETTDSLELETSKEDFTTSNKCNQLSDLVIDVPRSVESPEIGDFLQNMLLTPQNTSDMLKSTVIQELNDDALDDEEAPKNYTLEEQPTHFDSIENEQNNFDVQKDLPTIYVEQISVENDDADSSFLKNDDTIENSFGSHRISFPSKMPCTGRIRYSSQPIEEECEDLIPQQLEGWKSNEGDCDSGLELDRVSSPLESPARIVKAPQSVTVLRGESITLAIAFTGNPRPNVLWMKGGRILRGGGDRLSILEGGEMSVVTVSEVTADDSGKYVVSVENPGGGDSCFASVAVVGFPEPPGGEPTASEVTDHSLVLSWYGSMYDGGSVVTGYQVEMCCLPECFWYKVASSVNTSCSILGLSRGQRYLFRVLAENRYGHSHPSKESRPICLDDFMRCDTSSEEEWGEDSIPLVKIDVSSNFAEMFDLKEEVGKGRFGVVYRCVEKSSGRPRAAKVIRCLKLKDKEKVRQEIEIMSRLRHPKLMHVLAAFESGRNMIMVMEFISGGELFERVIADDFVLTEHDCILFMRQICDGVAYMHNTSILHLDLKPENILCKTRTSHKIKIIDFGLARFYKAEDNLRILFGTPEFVAPEVINYEPVTPASDMWSVGVICYVLLSGLSPFMGESDTETFSNITRGEMDFDEEAFDEISNDAKEFISALLIKRVKCRMTAKECLQHPWLAHSYIVQKKPISTEKLKRFIIRRKWQKSGTAIRALGRMVSLSRSSLGSSCDSFSPLGSPISSRSKSSFTSRSETQDSGDSDIFQESAR